MRSRSGGLSSQGVVQLDYNWNVSTLIPDWRAILEEKMVGLNGLYPYFQPVSAVDLFEEG